MRILGIDPGSTVTGFGVIDASAGRIAHVAHGTVRPPRKLDTAGRLAFIFAQVQSVAADNQHRRTAP